MKFEKIAVLGAGSWGTALANLLAASGHKIALWARDEAFVNTLALRRENDRFLPGFPLHPNIAPTSDMRQAASGANVILFAIPSGGIRQVAHLIRTELSQNALIVSASKGLEDGTGLRMSQVLAEVIPNSISRIVALRTEFSARNRAGRPHCQRRSLCGCAQCSSSAKALHRRRTSLFQGIHWNRCDRRGTRRRSQKRYRNRSGNLRRVRIRRQLESRLDDKRTYGSDSLGKSDGSGT